MMLTAHEIRSQSFEKSMRGYRPEDVQAFLAQVSATVEQLIVEKEETEKKLALLAAKVEEYRAQEESLKSALLNAQRLGDNMIYEAKQKGDSILNEATGKAKRILDLAQERERDAKESLSGLETEISAFKANILGLYQQHIESLSQIDQQVSGIHTAVFGGETLAEEQPELKVNTEEESAIDNAGSIVDSFQPTEE